MSNEQSQVPGVKPWGPWIRRWGVGDAKKASASGRVYPLGSTVKCLPKMFPLRMLIPVRYTWLCAWVGWHKPSPSHQLWTTFNPTLFGLVGVLQSLSVTAPHWSNHLIRLLLTQPWGML